MIDNHLIALESIESNPIDFGSQTIGSATKRYCILLTKIGANL
jgi:hypothetical protein